jgi:hypothetical protein
MWIRIRIRIRNTGANFLLIFLSVRDAHILIRSPYIPMGPDPLLPIAYPLVGGGGGDRAQRLAKYNSQVSSLNSSFQSMS